jgi:hypothetical protein
MIAGLGIGNKDRNLVDHYMMNFLPAVKKIKMDLFMKRKDKDGNPPIHLQKIIDENPHPADFNSIGDLYLAECIDMQRDNDTFFESSSVCKLIDRQFQYTRIIYLS